MNIEIGKITALGKKLIQKSVFSDRGMIHTAREWMIGLGLTVMAFVVGALYLGYDFYYNLNEDGIQTDEESTAVVYKRAVIESVLTTYRDRKEAFLKLRSDRSNYDSIQRDLESKKDEGARPLAEGEAGQYSSASSTKGDVTVPPSP